MIGRIGGERAGALAMTTIIMVGLTMFAPPLMGAQESGATSLGDADSKILGESANDTAGWSVASAGDVDGDGVEDLVVGVPGYDTESDDDAGAAFLFLGPVDRDEIELSEADVRMTGVEADERAGWSVASAGDLNDDGVDDVVIGAPMNDENGNESGAAYVVHGGSWLPASVSLDEANATLFGGEADLAGWSVANTSALPGNESGVIVGAPMDEGVPTNETGDEESGTAFLVGADTLAEGDSMNLDDDADVKLVGENEGDHAGASVSSAGDVDGDGVNDVLVGAPGNDASADNAGAAYLVLGSVEVDDGVTNLENADVTMVGQTADDAAGFAVAAAGDVDDDGNDDVLVGAPGNDAAEKNAGAAYVVNGGDSLPDELDLADADVRLEGEAEGDLAGWSVDSIGSGDATCDGVADVLVGAPGNDASAENAGAAYLVFGDSSLSGASSLADADRTFLGESANDTAGWSVASAGDLNDDGNDDVAIGAPREDTAAHDAGAAYVVHRDCPETEPDEKGYGYGYGYTSR